MLVCCFVVSIVHDARPLLLRSALLWLSYASNIFQLSVSPILALIRLYPESFCRRCAAIVPSSRGHVVGILWAVWSSVERARFLFKITSKQITWLSGGRLPKVNLTFGRKIPGGSTIATSSATYDAINQSQVQVHTQRTMQWRCNMDEDLPKIKYFACPVLSQETWKPEQKFRFRSQQEQTESQGKWTMRIQPWPCFESWPPYWDKFTYIVYILVTIKLLILDMTQ